MNESECASITGLQQHCSAISSLGKLCGLSIWPELWRAKGFTSTCQSVCTLTAIGCGGIQRQTEMDYTCTVLINLHSVALRGKLSWMYNRIKYARCCDSQWWSPCFDCAYLQQLLFIINAVVDVHMLCCRPASVVRHSSYIWWRLFSVHVLQSGLFMVDCYAMTKVLTLLCTVFSPINALSSRSNFASQPTNNWSGVIRVRPHKIPSE